MKQLFLILCCLVTLQISVYGQRWAKTPDGRTILLYDNGTWTFADSVSDPLEKPSNIDKLEIPAVESEELIVTHAAFTLSYNESHEQANWVAYELTKEETNKRFDRTDKFMSDPNVKTGSASHADYKGSGYDRGHLAPASDMAWSATAMAESFYYSNMSPQAPSFNRGIWKKLEELVRTWAVEDEAVYVVTGPVLSSGLSAIGPNRVSVPLYFYKAILDYRDPEVKAIGFILPNNGSQQSLQQFAVTIDSVEKFTGLDFFPRLPDEQERTLERTLCLECWSWKGGQAGEKEQTEKAAVSAQCKGVTKAGLQCRNRTLNINGYCHHHQAQVNSGGGSGLEQIRERPAPRATGGSRTVQCSGTTKAGNRCKRMTSNSNGRCYQH